MDTLKKSGEQSPLDAKNAASVSAVSLDAKVSDEEAPFVPAIGDHDVIYAIRTAHQGQTQLIILADHKANILIGIVALLVIGPERLPETIRTASTWLNRIRRGFNEIKQEVQQELHNDAVMRDLRKTGEQLKQEASNIGLDLQSSTKAAVAATISASQSRLELTTRILANGMKKLFKNMLKLSVTHQDKPRIVRLRNQWVAIDPRSWNATMDVSVNVALGNGDTDQKMAMLQMIITQQKEALMQMGPQNPLVSPAQFSNTLRKMVELAGFKDSSQFFNNVPADYQPPQKEEKPTPEEILAQVQAQSIQADIQKKAAELELDREKMLRSDDRERDRVEADTMLRAYEMQLKYGTQVDVASIKAMMERDREALRNMGQQMPQQPGVM